MRQKVYIHVGLHKTGTTSIQWALTFSRPELLSAGFFYPTAAIPEWAPYGQHRLAWSLVDRENQVPDHERSDEATRAGYWSLLREQIVDSSAPSTILSSEEFDILQAPEVRALKEQLSDFDIIPIIFLRNHADWLESCYRTAVMHSVCTREFADFVDNQRSRVDFWQMVQDWKDISTNGTLKIVSYDDERVKRNSTEAFFEIVGAPFDLLSKRGREWKNESSPAFVCEIVRFMKSKKCDDERIKKWVSDVTELGFTEGVNQRYTYLTEDLRNYLNEKYTSEISKIEGEWHGDQFGSLDLPVRRQLGQPIGNVVMAILALGYELRLARSQND